MMIRSQDDKTLLNMDNVVCVETQDARVGAYAVNDTWVTLGTYDTPEIAKKVIDEIQKVYLQYSTIGDYDCIRGAFLHPKVYQMPTEDYLTEAF